MSYEDGYAFNETIRDPAPAKDDWKECHICRSEFGRRTLTKRFCHKCGKGWCEGNHGNFQRGRGLCLTCRFEESSK